MSEDAAVVVRRLTKTYGKTEAVKGIDFEVAPGEVFGFLGPNGAGKTTTISMLCTLANPTGGTATVAGHDVVEERDEVRRNIGLVFQDPTLDGYLSAEQNLRFHAELYGVPRGAVDARIKRVMEMVALWDRKDAKVMTFSGGMKRRLEIARGLLHSPRVLFLDEPTVGLDAQTRQQIWQYLDRLRREWSLTVLTTTHYIEEVEDADVVCIIDHGKIIAQGSPERLKGEYGRRWLQVDTIDEATRQEVQNRFPEAQVLGVKSVVVPAESADPELFKTGVFEGKVMEVRHREPTLESVFLSLTGRELRDRADPGRVSNGRGERR